MNVSMNEAVFRANGCPMQYYYNLDNLLLGSDLKGFKNKSLLMFSFSEQEEKPSPLSLQSMTRVDQLQIN